MQVFGCLVNTLSKYIFMQQSTNFYSTRYLEIFLKISEFQNAEFYKKSKS